MIWARCRRQEKKERENMTNAEKATAEKNAKKEQAEMQPYDG